LRKNQSKKIKELEVFFALKEFCCILQMQEAKARGKNKKQRAAKQGIHWNYSNDNALRAESIEGREH
jgi:hypothetical protein